MPQLYGARANHASSSASAIVEQAVYSRTRDGRRRNSRKHVKQGQGTETYPTDLFQPLGGRRRDRCAGGIMSNLLSRRDHYSYLYRYMSNEYRRLAAKDGSKKTRNYYLQMAENYNRLAETAELKATVISA
jgi:hypothetical protein